MTVLAAIVAIGLAMPVVGRGSPVGHTVSTGFPYPVTARVSVVPPADSTVDLSATRPGLARGTVSFLMGPVRYVVVVRPYQGTMDGATGETRDKIISPPGYQVTAQECYFVTNSGLIGRWGRFGSWGWSGVYTVFVVSGLRIEMTATGTDARLNLEMAGIERSMRTLAYR